MGLKSIAKVGKKFLVDMELTSPFGKFIVVTAYKFALLLMGKYKRRISSVEKLISKTITKEENERVSYKKKLIDEILYCKIMYGIAGKEYFVYGFEKSIP